MPAGKLGQERLLRASIQLPFPKIATHWDVQMPCLFRFLNLLLACPDFTYTPPGMLDRIAPLKIVVPGNYCWDWHWDIKFNQPSCEVTSDKPGHGAASQNLLPTDLGGRIWRMIANRELRNLLSRKKKVPRNLEWGEH
jgi:hypothetical protein